MTDRLTDAQLTIIEKTGDSTAQSMARELIELRTRPAEPQGLTAEEREALQWTKALVERVDYDAPGKSTRTALAVLDRLLGCAEVRR